MSSRATAITDQPGYRADIDGLRAIAVSAVVMFHAFPVYLGGGFVGVDIFFTISGFLIASIVFSQLETGAFSLGAFYQRRVLRLFPALILVLASVLAAGWFLLLSDEYGRLGRSVLGSAAFVANVVFWTESGYFDLEAHTKPLLHLWSLGLEEQFYLVFPLLAVLLMRLRLALLPLLSLIAALSFLVNLWLTSTYASTAFYLLPGRMWELVAGAMLAAWYAVDMRPLSAAPGGNADRMELPATGRTLLSVFGLACIFAGFFQIDKSVAFPGALVLFPCLGTVCVIAAGPQALFNRTLLSNPLMVWVGKISYPLYLWHWPVLSIPMIIFGGQLPSNLVFTLVALSILLAALTYECVERPLKKGRSAKKQTMKLALLMVVVGLSGGVIHLAGGFPDRGANISAFEYEGDVRHLDFHGYVHQHFYTCRPKGLYERAEAFGEGIRRCHQSRSDRPVEIAVFGDSHAEHLFIGLAETMSQRNIAYYIDIGLPTLDNSNFDLLFDHVLESTSISHVVLAASWLRSDGYNLEAVRQAVNAFTRSGKRVTLLTGVPYFPYDAESCKLTRRFRSALRCDEELGESRFSERYRRNTPVLADIAAASDAVQLIDTVPYFCDGTRCSMRRGKLLLYRDSQHLNIPGSRYLAARLTEDYPHLFD